MGSSPGTSGDDGNYNRGVKDGRNILDLYENCYETFPRRQVRKMVASFDLDVTMARWNLLAAGEVEGLVGDKIKLKGE